MRASWKAIPDGVYQVPVDVPYFAQFASVERINDYIHHSYTGTEDPLWQTSGSPTPEDYAHWAPRICALAVIKMAVHAHYGNSPSLWNLVQEGLAFDGYTLHDHNGNLVDSGWYFDAQVKLSAKYGLAVKGFSYLPAETICLQLMQGHLVAATVSPELGESEPRMNRYAGHSVIIHGFKWEQGRLSMFYLHNPSGRYTELQANACVEATLFKKLYAFRFMTFKKL